jgi:hypothetical protein
MEMKIFESLMLICFGCAWPFSIYRTWKTKASTGKSLFFLFVILMGYVSGVLFKVYGVFDEVIYLYILNTTLVTVDIVLTIKYRNNFNRNLEVL